MGNFLVNPPTVVPVLMGARRTHSHNLDGNFQVQNATAQRNRLCDSYLKRPINYIVKTWLSESIIYSCGQ